MSEQPRSGFPFPGRFPFQQRLPKQLPAYGCLALAALFFVLCILPYFLAGAIEAALTKLHIHSSVAIFIVLAVFFGSLVNLPVYRKEQDELELDTTVDLDHLHQSGPSFRHVQSKSIIAVNVGGCIVPVLLAVWQIIVMVTTDARTFYIALFMSALNIAICYRIARPIAGKGIAIPGFIPPLVAVGTSWLLVRNPELRASAAFLAGVSGPLIGADLLHLRKIAAMQPGILSIGGAGTFDGIVLSGLLAALLA